MASYSATFTKHATLSGTTFDEVTIGSVSAGHRFGAIEVFNRSSTEALWLTFSLSATGPTTPTAAADNTFYVAPGSSLAIPVTTAVVNVFVVDVVGNGNAYSVHGIPVG